MNFITKQESRITPGIMFDYLSGYERYKIEKSTKKPYWKG
jgi:hypothetical protein